MNAPALREKAFWALAAASLLFAVAALLPPVPLTRASYDLLAVLDITGSMNTRDYVVDGQAISRLEASKAALRGLLADLPCGSKLGVGIFTERRVFLLFDPVETCANFPAIDSAIAQIDWRMGWEGESHISEALYRGAALAAAHKADILFFSDGQEEPPLPWNGGPSFAKPGQLHGLVVGVGGLTPSPIPKFDDKGRESGFWQANEIPRENFAAPPPPGAEHRPGYNPRNAPFGEMPHDASENLSALDTAHLTTLGAELGFPYMRLTGDTSLYRAVKQAARARPLPGLINLRAVPASLGLLAFLTACLLAVLRGRGLAIRMRMPHIAIGPHLPQRWRYGRPKSA